MVRELKIMKNDILHDHMHFECKNRLPSPMTRAAILFNAKNRHFPCISQRVIPAHFFRYGLKYSFQVRNFPGHNLVTGLKQFTQLGRALNQNSVPTEILTMVRTKHSENMKALAKKLREKIDLFRFSYF